MRLQLYPWESLIFHNVHYMFRRWNCQVRFVFCVNYELTPRELARLRQATAGMIAEIESQNVPQGA
jgi:small-conductance mechanosensitive channel